MPTTTGDEYIQRLRDERTVFYKGEQIDDVTTHSATREMIETQAELYDLQHDPKYRDLLTYESPSTGKRVPIFYKRPEMKVDLKQRRRASAVWQEYSCGVGGRSSDFLAAGLAGLAITADQFDREGHEYGSNVVDYYEYCRENDLCLTHALIDPQIDRSESSSFRTGDGAADRPGSLRMVEEREEGMVVSGARMLATVGPQADEILVFPFGFYGKDEVEQAVSFTIPIEADGLRLICRSSFSDNDQRNYPLTSRFDEMDVFVVFDEVFVPEERIFVKGNIEAANAWRETAQPNFAMHQTLTKDIAKSEFVFGVALMLVESTGIDEHFHVQSKLGELAETVQLLKNSVEAMEHHAEEYKDTGYVIPDYLAGSSAVSNFADRYRRSMEIIEDLGGSGLVGVPAYEDLEADDPLGSDVETYFRGKDMEARERIGVQKLARDLTLSGFGRREELYERFHVGGPMRVKSNLYKGYPDKDELKTRAREHGLRTVDDPEME